MTGILQTSVRTIICFINAVKGWRKIREANDSQCLSSVRAPRSYPSGKNFCLYLLHKSHEAMHCTGEYKLQTKTTVLSSTWLFHKPLSIFQLPHLKGLNQS